MPTDINEYIIPTIDLPDLWKCAITEKGQIYYYHTKILIPQWEPPIKLLPLMEEHRINDMDLKIEPVDVPMHSTDDDHDMEQEHDCDDEDEDVVSILSNSTMNPNCLLELKSDPILEKYNDDDTSSIDSDDSLVNELAELEAKYAYIKRKTDDYWSTFSPKFKFVSFWLKKKIDFVTNFPLSSEYETPAKPQRGDCCNGKVGFHWHTNNVHRK